MFDSGTFESITGGDPGVAREISDLFRTDSLELLDQLEAAIGSRAAGEVCRITHMLKSSCGSIGAMEASELARQIEQGGIDVACRRFESLKSAIQVAVTAMESLVGAG